MNDDSPRETSQLGSRKQAGDDDLTIGPYQGVILKDRYVLVRQIGHGGIGAVYLAHDKQLHGKPVVVKVMLDSVTNKSWVLRKFAEEIKALARIDHPGVVGALDSGEMPDGKPYIVMQYVEGVPLRKVIENGRVSFERVASIMRQIGHALNAAHERGIVHRDLKPDNIMVQQSGPDEEYIRLIDFGIASVQDPGERDVHKLTTVAGTIFYMAPEQLEGKPTPASDIFAMGIIAHEMLTGTVPFRPRTPYQLLDLHRQGITNRLTDLNPLIPREVEASILKALSYSENRRHATAREFGDEIARLLIAAARPPETARPEKPDTRVYATAGVTAVAQSESGMAVSPTDIHEAPTQIEQKEVPPPNPVPKILGIGLAAVLGAALLVVAGWYAFAPTPGPANTNNGTANTAATNATEQPPTQPERLFNYSITVQRTRGGVDFKEPFVLDKEVVFEQGYKIRLNLSSPQRGHLYILNEGEPAADGLPSYNILFPSPTANGGASLVPENLKIQIPGQTWFMFNEAVGTEKLWLVWADAPVPELEGLKSLANPVDRGAITNAEQLGVVRRFIAASSTVKPEILKDPNAMQSIVRGQQPVLVHMIPLVHQ